jgi:hypothetical protein
MRSIRENIHIIPKPTIDTPKEATSRGVSVTDRSFFSMRDFIFLKIAVTMLLTSDY